MLSIRRPLIDETALYREWYDKRHKHLIDKYVFPPSEKDGNKIRDKMWAIAGADGVQGFFSVDFSDEVEAAPGSLIQNFLLSADPDIDAVLSCITAYINDEYDNGNVYICIEEYLKRELDLMSLMNAQTVYTSMTMLKDDLSDIKHSTESNKVKIRTFRQGIDEDAFAALYYDIFKELSPAFSTEKIRTWTDNWVASATFDPDLYLIAEQDSRAIGMVAIELDGRSKEHGHLYEIGVLDGFKEQGLAGLLFHMCAGRAVEKGMRHLSTRVRKGNTKAYNFFSKLGFNDCFNKHYLKLAG